MAELDDVSGTTGSGMGRNTLKYVGLGAAGIALLGAGIWIGSQFIDREIPLMDITSYNRCTSDYHGPKGELEVFCFNKKAFEPVTDRNNDLIGMKSLEYVLNRKPFLVKQ